jgi:zinc protease
MTATLLPPILNRLHQPTLHALPNGLAIIAEQMPVEAVTLNLWLNVGSALEPDAINGMAHFLEHMVFKGTANLRSGEFEQRIEQRGAVTNAATSQDYTHYYITTAPQDFADLAPLQADVVLNATIPEDGFMRERQVVLEEIRRSHDNPQRRTFQQVTELTFEQLPYRRQVLGPTEVIAGLTPEQMREFHQAWYQPEHMTAVVVGNLPVDRLIRIVENSFASLGQHSQPSRLGQAPVAPPCLQPETPFASQVRRDLVDPSLQQARLVMTWRVPGFNQLAETYALDIVAAVLGRGRTARLVQDLREKRGLVSGISASNITYQHQGAFYISAQLPAENLPIVEQSIAQHLRDLQTDLMTEFEIARIRTRTANQFIFGNETPSDRSSLYGYYYTLLRDLAPALSYPEQIQAISAETVRAAVQRYLSPDAYGVVTIRPS